MRQSRDVQIESTIQIKAKVAKQSWWDMDCSLNGQETVISFYLDRILIMIGYTDTHTKKMINFRNTAWGFLNCPAIVLFSPRFEHRTMFLTGAYGLLKAFIAVEKTTYSEGGDYRSSGEKCTDIVVDVEEAVPEKK
ncbi:hypothetical protein MBM_00105 [Drepanopeziza brunnea f. sp. 'multigermtubi' MB_m1]|uniref:Uncharacterized protein n=1 Tax=Marssonina brunnea f. sp. multigermtubi (strain MB_m1) TaxID=1072389 RepID=K1X7A2_MARBU|nr:uncharacterized protein MBM_00105 [Drepanopeziza brunnea f. sp. 'multigermtubi' MB_m1]EKD20992.1 hypothetical protein MBM_00105 [Drepanopeziza brunnea f. sp. 'multigermtubi' MB_m1]